MKKMNKYEIEFEDSNTIYNNIYIGTLSDVQSYMREMMLTRKYNRCEIIKVNDREVNKMNKIERETRREFNEMPFDKRSKNMKILKFMLDGIVPLTLESRYKVDTGNDIVYVYLTFSFKNKELNDIDIEITDADNNNLIPEDNEDIIKFVIEETFKTNLEFKNYIMDIIF